MSGPFFSCAMEVVKSVHATVWLRATAWDSDYVDARANTVRGHMPTLMVKPAVRKIQEEMDKRHVDSHAIVWSSQKHLSGLAKDLQAINAEAALGTPKLLH